MKAGVFPCRSKERPHAGGERYAGYDASQWRAGQGGKSKCCSRLVQHAAIRIRGGNDNDVSEMRKRNEKRLSVQQQGRCVKFCKRSAENRDDGNCEDHSLKGKGGVF